MNNLESDIQNTQKHIIQSLTQYEKKSEQLISLNYTTQLHNILDAISTFDPEQLKAIQQQLKDEIALKHINTISSKIKASTTPSKPASNVNPQPAKRQPKITKEEPRKNESKAEQKKQGFFGSVLKRFASKQKKASQIILPDSEPNCYYDPVKRIWIFQGQDPEVPKEIPKPPSKSQIIKPKQAKPQQQQSEMNNLTAPPEFKRKGTGPVVKKVKKQVKTVETSEEPMVFAKVIDNINKQYESLLKKVRSGFYELPVKDVHVDNQNQLTEFVRLAQVILHSSEQIVQYQHRLVQKFNKSSAGEGHELKLLQKILKEVSQSSNIYSRISNNLQSISRQSISRGFRSDTTLSFNYYNLHKSPQNIQTEMFNKFRYQMQTVKLENQKLINDLSFANNQKKTLDNDLKIIYKQKEDLLSQNQKLKNQIAKNRSMIDQLSAQNAENNKIIEKTYMTKQLQLKKYNQQLLHQNKELISKIQNIKKEYQKLQEAKAQVQKNLVVLQSNNNNSSEKMKDEILKQKAKIQSQLKFYEEKEKNFLKNMKNIQEHTTIIQEFEDTLKQENKLLNAILQQRIQLSKINDYQENLPIYHKNIEEFTSPHTVILQLSDIINSITQTHLQRLESFNRNYTTLSKKYQQAKQLNKKIKNSTVSQNMSLNRSVSRLKSLIESYKTAKDEAQERNTHLQLQCEKLRKKLEHYKQEDKFNKSYLSKIKSSGSNNQNESMISLQQDNEQLAQTIEDLQKQVQRKDQNCIKLQKDLQDILANYEKTQQKLLNMQKKFKENERQLRILKEEKQSWMNKITSLQAKIASQKEKSEEVIQKQLSKFKSIENNYQKKLNILRQELKRSQSNEQQLKSQMEQLIEQKNNKIMNLQNDFKIKISQLQSSLEQKENELGQLLLLVQQSNQNIGQKEEQIRRLHHAKNELEKNCVYISQLIQNYNQDELHVLKESEKSHNNMIEQMLQLYKSFKEQELDFRKDYEAKIQYLMSQLQDSQNQSRDLLESINQYSTLLNNLDEQLRMLQKQKQDSKQQSGDKIKSLKIQNRELAKTIELLQAQILQKNQEMSDLQLLTQSLSSEVQSLRNENTEFGKINNEKSELQGRLQQKDLLISRHSEELATKIAEIMKLESKLAQLQEQNKILCTQLQNAQIQACKKQLAAKNNQIANLTNELNKFSNELLTSQMKRDDQSISNYEQLIKKLKGALSDKQKQVQELSEALQTSNSEQLILQVNNKQMQKKYEQSKAVINVLQKQIAQLKKSLFQIIDDNKSLRLDNQKYKLSLQSKQNQLNDIKNKNINNNQKIQELRSSITQLQENIKEQQISSKEIEERKDEDVEGEMEYILKEIQDRENQIKELEEQLALKNNQIKQTQQANYLLNRQNEQLRINNSQLIDALQILQKKTKSQINQIQQLQNQNKQLAELLQNLQKEQLSSQQAKLQIPQLNKLQQQLAQLQISNQQNLRLKLKAQKQLSQRYQIIDELQTRIGELSELLEHNEKLLQNNRNQESSKTNTYNQLRQELIGKDNQIAELKRKLQEINRLIVQKQYDFEGKIQSLEKQVISLNSLKVTNKKLEDQYKQLESENSILLSEKVELMRSNDNLMKINQKLVTEISPQNSQNKNSSKTIPKPAQKPQQIVQSPKKQQRQEAKSELKQAKFQKQEAKGFLGTLSSFFLTPTETDRLVRK